MNSKLINKVFHSFNEEVESESRRAKNLLGLVAVLRDLIAVMAIQSYQTHNNQIVKPTLSDAVNEVNKSYRLLSREQRRAIKKSLEFHYAAEKLNQLNRPHAPIWRDVHSLSYAERLAFFNIVNRYSLFKRLPVTGG